MNDLAEIGSHVFLGNDLRSWVIAAVQFAVWFTVLPLVRAIVTRPGAPSRAGEVDDVAAVLRDWYPDVARIVMPGTVDGDGRLVISADLPRVAARLHALGCQTVPLEMSEFRKMDGGLSCLSLLLGERTHA